MDDLCANCGHSRASHPSCSFCDCNTFVPQTKEVTEDRQVKGPASEVKRDEWCVDCGHNKKVHDEENHKCNYWTDLCECEGFVSRSEALIAVRKAGGFIAKSDALRAVRKLEEDIREG